MKLNPLVFFIYAYLITFGLITRIFPLTDTYKALLSQPALILFPYLVGKSLLYLIRKFLSAKENREFVIEFIITWSLGVISIMLLEVVLYVNYLFTLKSFVVLLLFIGLPSLIIGEEYRYKRLNHIDIWIVAIYGFLFAIFVTQFWGYPYANENDYIRHTFYTIQIVNENRPLVFYSPYLPTLHTLYAILMIIFNINTESDPLFLLWSSRFLFYPIYAVGIYLFSSYLSKNRLFALLTTIIGSSLVYSYEGSLFPYHTAPKNLVSILFIYTLYASLSLYDDVKHINLVPVLFKIGGSIALIFFPLYFTRDIGPVGYEIGFLLMILFILILLLTKTVVLELRNFFLFTCILLLVLVFFHKVNGFIGVFTILIFLFLLSSFEHISEPVSKFLTAISIIISLSIFAIFYFNILPYPDDPIFSPPTIKPYFLYGWSNIFNLLKEVYPTIILILFEAGCIFAVVTEKNQKLLVAVFVASLLVFMYFFPLYASYRYLIYAHIFIIIFSVYAIFNLVKIKGFSPNKKHALLFVFFILTIGLNIYINDIKQFEQSRVIRLQNQFQVFEIGEYLKNNINKDAIIIGYSSGTGWYQGISAFYGNIFTVNLWKNGNYRDNILRSIYLANSSEEAYLNINQLIDNNESIVNFYDPDKKEIDRWHKKPSEIIVLYDDALAQLYGDKKSVYKFFDPQYFTMLYQVKDSRGNNFYIFKLNTNQ